MPHRWLRNQVKEMPPHHKYLLEFLAWIVVLLVVLSGFAQFVSGI